MKTILKVLAWICVGVAILGGPQVMFNQNFAWPSLAAEAFWIGMAWLCFRGAKRKSTESSK